MDGAAHVVAATTAAGALWHDSYDGVVLGCSEATRSGRGETRWEVGGAEPQPRLTAKSATLDWQL